MKHKKAIYSLSLAHLFNDIHAEFVPTILPLLIRKFGLSLSSAGLYGNFIGLLSSFLQPIFGILSDQKQTRLFAIIGPFTLGLSVSLLGFIDAEWQLLPLLMLGALGTASFHPPATGLTGYFSREGGKHELAISIFIIGGTIGAALSPLLVYVLLGEKQELGHLIYALPFGLIASLCVAIGVPSIKAFSRNKTSFRLRKWRSRSGSLFKLMLLVVFRSTVVMAFLTFLPEFFYQIQEQQGKTTLLIGALSVFLFTGSGSIGGVSGSLLSKRFPIFYILITSFILALPLAWLFFETKSFWVLVLLGISINLSQALTVSLAQRLIPENAATASSIIMGFGWGFAILLMPLLGYFGDMLGLNSALQFHSIIFIALALLVVLWLRKDLARKKLFQVLAVLLLVSSLPAAAVRLTRINNVSLSNSSLVLAHDSKTAVQFKKITMAQPPRAVFDILNADISGKTQKFTNPAENIKEVRLAQFSPTTVRVTVEAANTAALNSVRFENLGQNLYFRFGVEDTVVEEPVLNAAGELVINASAVITARASRLEAPSRLVVDIVGATLRDPALKKSLDNAGEQIKVVQLDKSTIRVTFTGASSQGRSLRLSEDQKQLVISPKTAAAIEISPDKAYTLALVSQSEYESTFLIQGNKDISYKFLKLHNPERLVIDLYGIAYDAKQVAISATKTTQVTALRFGIATLGRPVTRVVMDLAEEGLIEEFKVGADSKQLLVKVYKLSPDKAKDGGEVPKANKAQGAKVVVDAGHGGYDPGAIYDDRQEKDITLQISRKVKQYLEEAGVIVYMTRSEDRFVALAERVEVSNTIDPSAFVSIHANALPTNPHMEGLQTYYYHGKSKKLASSVHQQLLDDVKMPDQRVRSAGFWVCKHTAAPSILVETGFMTCAKERRRLVDDNYQTELAKAIARGVIKYLEE